MYPGYQLRLTTNCEACGLSMVNALSSSSAFMRLACSSPNCSMNNAWMVVERATMIVLLTNYKIVNGKPAWPSHWVDANGRQVLPEPGQVTGA